MGWFKIKRELHMALLSGTKERKNEREMEKDRGGWIGIDTSYSSWELWILLISTVLGKIDDLRRNGKSYSIKKYFFMEKQKILPQFDDPTT